MTLAWFAKQPHMGIKMHLKRLLYWERRNSKKHDAVDRPLSAPAHLP
jgi:hypothetical protein